MGILGRWVAPKGWRAGEPAPGRRSDPCLPRTRRAAGPVLAMRPQQAPVSGKVFIQRDYSSGTRCQFQTKFPAELENRVRTQPGSLHLPWGGRVPGAGGSVGPPSHLLSPGSGERQTSRFMAKDVEDKV